MPLLAKLTHQSNAQVVALVSQTFPSVGKVLASKDNAGQPFADGQSYLQHASGYVTTVSSTVAAQQHNFDNARQIPVKGLPTIALSWLFVILGVVTLAIGGLTIWRPGTARAMGAALMALGLAVVAITLIIDVPGKTQSVDNLTNAFRPVFATSGPLSIDQGAQYLNNVGAADTTLETQLLPTLSTVLRLPQSAVAATLTQASPQVAAALFTKAPGKNVSPLRDILNRWTGLAYTVKSQRSNFGKADDLPGWGMPTTIVQFLLAGPALILVLCGLALVAKPMRAQQPAPSYRGARASMG